MNQGTEKKIQINYFLANKYAFFFKKIYYLRIK
jgi:hypothetical protein